MPISAAAAAHSIPTMRVGGMKAGQLCSGRPPTLSGKSMAFIQYLGEVLQAAPKKARRHRDHGDRTPPRPSTSWVSCSGNGL
jgi:hypothetical protein